MAYHAFKDEDGNEYGSFEVFYVGPEGTAKGSRYDFEDETGGDLGPGWYWWACYPGCLPESDPAGPFEDEQEAIDDALSNS